MRKFDFSFNENFPVCDQVLLDEVSTSHISEEEKEFVERMVFKEIYEYAISPDIILLEDDNDEEIFIIRWYDSEYEIGRGKIRHRKKIKIHPLSLSELLVVDLFDLLGTHLTVLEWLRARQFKGLKYDRWEED